MTKMPRPWREDRNAIDSPSGEKAGSVSSAADSFVRSIAFWPPTLCR